MPGGNGEHAPTIFPGLDGLPFRLKSGQQFPMLKHNDPEYAQPQPVADAHVKVFDLSNEDDVKEYAEIWDKAAKGLIMISAEERHWSDKKENFKIFLRWGEVYLEMPKNQTGRSSGHGYEIN